MARPASKPASVGSRSSILCWRGGEPETQSIVNTLSKEKAEALSRRVSRKANPMRGDFQIGKLVLVIPWCRDIKFRNALELHCPSMVRVMFL